VPGVRGSPGLVGGFDGGPAQRPRAGLRQRTRIGSSVRRYYDLPVEPTTSAA
jgi:hypothetical protein